jgi:hypothetical protein
LLGHFSIGMSASLPSTIEQLVLRTSAPSRALGAPGRSQLDLVRELQPPHWANPALGSGLGGCRRLGPRLGSARDAAAVVLTQN